MTRQPEQSDRKQIQQILTANVRALDDRIEEAWDGDLTTDDERLQLTRLRTLAHLAREYRLLARDADLDEMEAEVDLLQEATALTDGEDK
ncbi:hypothetical protein [Halosegnis rubeus]|uniref:DUF8136 domain-containing protein n=1 Tax=Halosegnis rubeus TaxID=2212850 RepID=A0A5N5UL24_9EURY|nr:hypothetical protein [Halosegnis rubeus]KAB7519460.1 hypothetical protein DP108_04995 [Halosegnis rubeus]